MDIVPKKIRILGDSTEKWEDLCTIKEYITNRIHDAFFPHLFELVGPSGKKATLNFEGDILTYRGEMLPDEAAQTMFNYLGMICAETRAENERLKEEIERLKNENIR